MTPPLWCLWGAMALGLVHIGTASLALKAQLGNRFTVGPRDNEIRSAGVAGRLDRALRNYLETFPIFAAAVLTAHLLGREGALATAGSLAYLAGRLAYLPLYAAGVPWLRTIAWNAATAGVAFVLLALAL